MADPTIDSPDEAQSLARLIQSGQITGPARDRAMAALHDYDATGAQPVPQGQRDLAFANRNVSQPFNRGVLDLAGTPMMLANLTSNALKGLASEGVQAAGYQSPSWLQQTPDADVIGTGEYLKKHAAQLPIIGSAFAPPPQSNSKLVNIARGAVEAVPGALAAPGGMAANTGRTLASAAGAGAAAEGANQLGLPAPVGVLAGAMGAHAPAALGRTGEAIAPLIGRGGAPQGQLPGPVPQRQLPAPEETPYNPTDPSLVPQRATGTAVRPTRTQTGSGLARGRLLDPVTIDAQSGQIIDHPAEPAENASPGGGGGEGGGEPPERPIDDEPSATPLPSNAVPVRAAILQRLGFTRARLSALQADGPSADTDAQLAKSDSPAGREARGVFANERSTLARFMDGLITQAGGTSGVDEASLVRRGQTIAKAGDAIRQSLENARTAAYNRAQQSAEASGATLPLQGLDAVIDDPVFRAQQEARGMGQLPGAVRKIVDAMRTNTPNGFTPAGAEQVRQAINAAWTPENAWAIRRYVKAIDGDVQAVDPQSGAQLVAARQRHAAMEQQLGDESGLSDLFDVDPRNSAKRVTPFEKLPDAILKLPDAQFSQLWDMLGSQDQRTITARQARAAQGEIRGQLLNRMQEAGNGGVPEAAWNSPKVRKFVDNYSSKLETAFGDSPDLTQGVRDVVSGGQILRADRSYPGAANQVNALQARGALANLAPWVGGTAGGAIGSVVGGPHLGGPAGAGLGVMGGTRIATQLAERNGLKNWRSRMVDLDSVAPPDQARPAGPPGGAPQNPGSGPGPAPAPRPSRTPRQPRTPPAGGGGPPNPTASPAPSGAGSGAPPGPPPAAPTPPPVPATFPTQGYTRAGYDRAQLAHELGVPAEVIGQRVLMLHNEAQRALEAGDAAKAKALTAERDALMARSPAMPPPVPAMSVADAVRGLPPVPAGPPAAAAAPESIADMIARMRKEQDAATKGGASTINDRLREQAARLGIKPPPPAGGGTGAPPPLPSGLGLVEPHLPPPLPGAAGLRPYGLPVATPRNGGGGAMPRGPASQMPGVRAAMAGLRAAAGAPTPVPPQPAQSVMRVAMPALPPSARPGLTIADVLANVQARNPRLPPREQLTLAQRLYQFMRGISAPHLPPAVVPPAPAVPSLPRKVKPIAQLMPPLPLGGLLGAYA